MIRSASATVTATTTRVAPLVDLVDNPVEKLEPAAATTTLAPKETQPPRWRQKKRDDHAGAKRNATAGPPEGEPHGHSTDPLEGESAALSER
jgi:hypothetical protein